MDPRERVLAAAVAACIALALLAVAAPFMAPPGSFRHLDGTAGLIDGGFRGHGPAGALYALGDLLCHQQEARSFVLNGSQMPVCMRDTGIVFGAAAGFAAAIPLRRSLPDARVAVLASMLIALMGAEWAVETTGFDSPFLRTLSGFGAGVGAALLLSHLLYRDADVPCGDGLHRVRHGTASGDGLARIRGVSARR